MAALPGTVTVTPEFATCFRRLVVGLQPRDLDREALAVYFSVLKKLDPGDVTAAVDRLLESSRFFPTTGEWFQVANEIEVARLRRDEVYHRPDEPPDPISPQDASRILNNLRRQLGVPISLREMAPADEDAKHTARVIQQAGEFHRAGRRQKR